MGLEMLVHWLLAGDPWMLGQSIVVVLRDWAPRGAVLVEGQTPVELVASRAFSDSSRTRLESLLITASLNHTVILVI